MDRMNKLIVAIGGILAIADAILKYVKISDLSLLTKPLVAINLLEVIILLVVMLFIYRFLPGKLYHVYLQRRSGKFWQNWKRFKQLLTVYSKTNNDNIQKEYEELREKLEIDFNFFLSSIKSIQEVSHRQHNDVIIGNFEQCITVRDIADWQNKIKRTIPAEIDCFDYLIIALKEGWKKPHRK